jgi:hypothetical protein
VKSFCLLRWIDCAGSEKPIHGHYYVQETWALPTNLLQMLSVKLYRECPLATTKTVVVNHNVIKLPPN